MKSIRTLQPPRRDPSALGFGVAFIAYGVLGLLHAGGVGVPVGWLYPSLLIGLGAAGLASLGSRGRR